MSGPANFWQVIEYNYIVADSCSCKSDEASDMGGET